MPLNTIKIGAGTAALALLLTAVATPASAQRRGPNRAGIAAGVIGGVAAGAILGGALAGPAYGRGGPGVYDDDGYAGDGGCGYAQQEVFDAYGRFLGYRTVPTC